MIIAKWNVANATEYHCIGHWTLTIDGFDYSNYIPVEKRTQPMGTLIDHCDYKDGHYIHYFSGQRFGQWWAANTWIDKIPAPAKDIYNAFRLFDWACGSCATCVKNYKEKNSK